jgi:imidazolonepropionase-like amidohydrolase
VAEQRISEGADWLKIFATTGSADDLSDKQNFFYSEIKAATDIAHAAGLRVAVHSYGPSAVSDALRAGVDSIEHPAGLTDELISRWLETETVYVPTIDHNRYYAEFSDEYGYTENTNKNLWQFIERNLESLRMAHKAGIRIAMGSDSVMSMFGQNTRELEWFVKAGMSNAEALSAATLNGAILLGQQDFLGRLKPGFAADIVAVKGNPLEDIRAVTQQVKFVMKAGNIIELQ